jgi:dienelactone hydrolase
VSGLGCGGALIYGETGKPQPLLLMAPNWRGVTKENVEVGKMLAGKGYVVFVADMFGEGKGPKGTENPTEFLAPFIAGA